MASFLKALKRFFCGFPKYKTLQEFIENIQTLDDAMDYAKQRFTYEKDKSIKDEWLPPDAAYVSLITEDSPSDCEEYAVVFDAWCKAKGIPSWLVAVWRNGEGHAICVAEINNRFHILDNFYRDMWAYASMADVCREVYTDATKANYVKFNYKINKFMYAERII